MPPIAIVAVAALGAAVLGRWAVREYRRVNAELDKLKAVREQSDRSRLRTLRRDPVSGEYRP